MKKIAVVFDLDDTLYPESEYVKSGFLAVSGWLEKKCGKKNLFDVCWKNFTAGIRGKIFNKSLEEAGFQSTTKLVNECVQIYRNHDPQICLFPDIGHKIDRMASCWILGLITDGYYLSQQKKIKALGLEQKIPYQILSDAWGRAAWKPSPIPFLEFMKKMKFPIQQFVYVGDNPDKDFTGCRKLGWKTVRIRRPGTEHFAKESLPGCQPDREIASISELFNKLP